MQFQRIHNSVGYLSASLLAISISACGGGGSATETITPEYSVTASAGNNGSITPASVTISEGETADFTITADENYIIDSITGCGGTLTDTTYTTGKITADCEVNASFTYALSERALIDPTPGTGDEFGAQAIVLANGNIAVADPNDSSVLASAGAVHLYDGATQTIIKSIYGDNANDRIGSADNSGLVDLGNGSFIIASQYDTQAGHAGAGSVMLVDGTTGKVIKTLAGDDADDNLASGGITVLNNGNYVILSSTEKVGGITVGAVILVNGSTGDEIGRTNGASPEDINGIASVLGLSNGNYVLAAPVYDDGAVNAGAVILFNGTTGAEIGRVAGDNDTDLLGIDGVYGLNNGNYVIASSRDDRNTITDAGSVMLIDGNTGKAINVIEGEDDADFLGRRLLSQQVTVLSNGNFVIPSFNDDDGGITDAGTVRLINGTGLEIARVSGDDTSDLMGSAGVTALSNGNYVIASDLDDVGGISNAGSAILVNGVTGAVISSVTGDTPNDRIGFQQGPGVVALTNGNYIIASPEEDAEGLIDNGTVRLVNGTTGTVINMLAGDDNDDFLSFGELIALPNGNAVIGTETDAINGLTAAGSVKLVDGLTGQQISELLGDDVDDLFGIEGSLTPFGDDYIVLSRYDDVSGVTDAGSLQILDGDTGAVISKLFTGSASLDFDALGIVVSPDEQSFVYHASSVDKNGYIDSGAAGLISQ